MEVAKRVTLGGVASAGAGTEDDGREWTNRNEWVGPGGRSFMVTPATNRVILESVEGEKRAREEKENEAISSEPMSWLVWSIDCRVSLLRGRLSCDCDMTS